MGKCKYSVRENKNLGTHSFFAVHQPTGTLTFDEAIKFACKNTDIEESAMRKDITEFMRTVQDFVLMGYRVALGDQFLTVYPVISASAKDEKDAQGNVTRVATAKDVTVAKSTSRLGCSVSSKFSKRFDMEVSWQRVDDKGNEVSETDITQGNDPDTTGGTGDQQTGGDTNLEP